MKTLIIVVALIGLAAVIGAIVVGTRSFEGLVVEKPYETGLAWCEIDRGPCSRKVRDATVTFDVNQKPVKAMRDLVFEVSLKEGGDPGEVVVDLSMPGMYMGGNRVILKRESPGKYSGRGIIPKCPSGRRLWRAAVIAPVAGEVEFFFNVGY